MRVVAPARKLVGNRLRNEALRWERDRAIERGRRGSARGQPAQCLPLARPAVRFCTVLRRPRPTMDGNRMAHAQLKRTARKSPGATKSDAKPDPKKIVRLTAADLAEKQREISVSEFFTKNRHLLG